MDGAPAVGPLRARGCPGFREHRAPVALFLWREPRGGNNGGRLHIIVRIVFDLYAVSAELFLDVANEVLYFGNTVTDTGRS